MPSTRRRWTTAEVRALTNEERAWPRYELIDGELLVTPAPSWQHQAAVGELFAALREYLRREGLGIVLMAPADLELRAGTITQPDLFVVTPTAEPFGSRLAWSDVHSLLLAIEIISPSSHLIDRGLKRRFYLNANVDEYWIVDVDARSVERWTADRTVPEIHRDRLTWRPTAASEPLDLDLVVLFDAIDEQSGARRAR